MALTNLQANPFRATATFAIETFYDQLWGFKPNIVAPLVQQKGAVRSLLWAIRNTLKYTNTLERQGPLRTHLLTATISTINGCAYCTFAQAFALQLHYLQQTSTLFPLTEREIVNLCGQAKNQILSTLSRSLTHTPLESEALSLQRLSELHHSPSLATTAQDHQLAHLLKMFATLNTCGIRNHLPTDQAHSPINKNRALRDRYFTLRAAERSQPAVAQPVGITVLNPADVSNTY